MAQHFSAYWRSGLRLAKSVAAFWLMGTHDYVYMQRVNEFAKKCLPPSKERCYRDIQYTVFISYAHVQYVSIVSVLTNQ